MYSPSDNVTEVDKNQGISTDSSALEATQAAKTLWCRVRLSLEWTTSRLLMLCACKKNFMALNVDKMHIF